MLSTAAFDNDATPAISGLLRIPQFRAEGVIRFLIDTGASHILLQPIDGQRIGVPYDRLTSHYAEGPQGIGLVPTGSYRVDAEVIFSDGHYRYAYDVMVDIVNPDTVGPGRPNLLGRSILHQWRIVYDHANRVLDIEPAAPCRKSPKVFGD